VRLQSSAVIATTWVSPKGQLYLEARPHDAWHLDSPLAALCRFVRRVDSAALLSRCQARHPGQTTVTVALRLDANADRIAIELQGKGAQAPIGRCLHDGLAAEEAAFRLGGPRFAALELVRTHAFPGATRLLGDQDACADVSDER
jgi:hypothetical protein